MNFLICHERFLFRFGADRVLLLLAKGLKELGHSVSLMANRYDREIVRSFASQIIEVPLEFVEYGNLDEFTTDWLARNWQEYFNASNTPDIVVVGGWPFFSAIPFFRNVGSKVFFSDHGVVPGEGYPESTVRILKKIRQLRKQYLQHASLIIGVSEFIVNSQSTPDSQGKVPVRSVLNGANHLEMSLWQAQFLTLNQSTGKAMAILSALKQRGKKTLLSLGRWEPGCYKNSEAAFDIMPRIHAVIPECVLLVLADPSETEIPGSLKETIIPIGFPDDHALAEVMKQVELGLSFSQWEGFNLPLAEMQWLNQPALVFNIGAHPEVVAHPWYLCRDNAEMAAKACEILSGRGLDRKTSARALATFRQHFRWERTIQAYLDIFEQLRWKQFDIIMDVSNATRDPANSGVIRVTRRLCRELQRYHDPIFVIWNRDMQCYMLPTRAEFQQLAQFNGPELTDERRVSPDNYRVILPDVLKKYEKQPAWLIFTETMNEAHAGHIRRYARENNLRLGAIFYDAIAVIKPEFCNDEIKENHSNYMRGLAECDIVIPISHFSAHCLQDFWHKNSIPETTVLPNPLPGEFGGVERHTQIRNPSSDNVRILCVSTLEPRKNHRTLIEACLLLKQHQPDLKWSLTLVGNRYAGAPHIPEYIESVSAQHPNIKWAGVVDDATLHQLYCDASFTVYPSLIEGFGMPIMESLWHGRPCICSQEGVMAELATEGGCLTTNVTDERVLAETIYRLATDQQLCLKLSREAVTRKIKTWDEYAREFISLLQAIELPSHINACPDEKRGAEIARMNIQDWQEILYPNCLGNAWQMNHSERLAITAVLSRYRPTCTIEVGTYQGGSLSLLSQFSQMVFSIDIDASIPEKLTHFSNVSFLTGPSSMILPLLLNELDRANISVNFILIDGDHSMEGVKRDITCLLAYIPKQPLFMMLHDSFNPDCRRGMLEAEWERSPYVQWLDLDFIPGRMVEDGSPFQWQVWGGLALAYFTPVKRTGRLPVHVSANMMHEKLAQPQHQLSPPVEKQQQPAQDKSQLWEPNEIEYQATPEQLDVMLSALKKIWVNYGQTEPFWSVLGHDAFKSQSFHEHQDEFYQSGFDSAKLLFDSLDRNGIKRKAFNTCLEFGCGTGRITAYLAQEFQRILACDISTPHLQLAREHTSRQGLKNIAFHNTLTPHDILKMPPVNVVFSLIVLQHNAPPLIAEYLRAFFKILRPGGVAFFQVPTYRQGYKFSIAEYMEFLKHNTIMEMHVIPQKAVIEIAHEHQCIVREVREDNWTGSPEFISNTFLIQRL